MTRPSLGLLSRLWLREPDAETLAKFALTPSPRLREENLRHSPSPRLRGEGWGEGRTPHADDLDALAAAYTDLFLLNVYPYGTAFTDPSGELNGPTAWETARRYEEHGFSPPELFEVGAPDHVGLCLGFLEHLARSREKDVEFLSSLLEWIPVCCLAVEREPSAHPFYRALATVTRERLMEDIPDVLPLPACGETNSERLPLPACGERVGVRGEEEEEIGVSQIVRFLLAPARSGLFLSRARLGQVARTAGMRLPFGSRFDVARVLFQTAGESGRVGTVLDLLDAELAAWETAYRGWAEEHPRWAPAAARWLHRTGETRSMLVQMREILENPPELEYVEGEGGKSSRTAP